MTEFYNEYKNSMIYVERIQSNGILRKGIIGAIDLEEYDFSKGSTSEVRATEATVIERIPPRIKVRQGAPLELPHIMILVDDEKDTVFSAIDKNNLEKLYDTKLMQNGGEVYADTLLMKILRNLLIRLCLHSQTLILFQQNTA